MKAYGSLTLGTLLLLGSSAAFAQQHKASIDDSGKVITAHQHIHVKVGHTMTWSRSTGAAKPWAVKFGESPCSEGTDFASNGTKVCTINVACKAKGDPGCKAYSYQSSTGPGAPLHDPDVIVDP